MQPADYPRVKICCISSIWEAELALKYGADAIGLVGSMPSGPGIISDELIAEITSKFQGKADTFLLTSEVTADGIINHHKKVNTATIQIVDRVDTGIYEILRNELTGVKLVQVIHVIDEDSISEAKKYSAFADALLLDSGNPDLSIKQLGGTGRTHNWDVSKTIRDSVDIPVYLAGGINPDNVKDAFEYVKPYGIDLCSGVRTNGKLDEIKLIKFFDQINKLKLLPKQQV